MKRILILLAFCSLMTIAPSCLTTRYDRDDRRDDNGGILIERNKRIVRGGDADRDDRALTRRERREERREQRERERERQNRDSDKPVIVIDPNR